ncbi:hypothetical protein TWF730_007333 [Orbilia blumenaviensis]|uniref:Uncharacterized protein n=1 Tax=Orbilia blumenaviensis TaxID=1796055 RepID=A0AAV9V9T0_9PEZI
MFFKKSLREFLAQRAKEADQQQQERSGSEQLSEDSRHPPYKQVREVGSIAGKQSIREFLAQRTKEAAQRKQKDPIASDEGQSGSGTAAAQAAGSSPSRPSRVGAEERSPAYLRKNIVREAKGPQKQMRSKVQREYCISCNDIVTEKSSATDAGDGVHYYCKRCSILD